MTTLLLVMAGSALGAPSRWLLDRWINRWNPWRFPLGTFVINVVGSFLLGVLVMLAARHSHWYALLGTGFCGGFTTFSTFNYENIRLFEKDLPGLAMLNLLGSALVGLVAVFAGFLAGSIVT